MEFWEMFFIVFVVNELQNSKNMRATYKAPSETFAEMAAKKEKCRLEKEKWKERYKLQKQRDRKEFEERRLIEHRKAIEAVERECIAPEPIFRRK